MIIFRPHRGGLAEAMAEAKEFNSLKDMLEYIVDSHNNGFPGNYFKINIRDLHIEYYGENDERVGWHDLFIVCYKAYKDIEDKDGYLTYFGGEKADSPCGVIGFFSTNYEQKGNEIRID